MTVSVSLTSLTDNALFTIHIQGHISPQPERLVHIHISMDTEIGLKLHE